MLLLFGLSNFMAKYVPWIADFSHVILKNGIVTQADRILAQRAVDSPPTKKVCTEAARRFHSEMDIKQRFFATC